MTFDLNTPLAAQSPRATGMTTHQPSEFQEAIYSAVRESSDNLLIEAVAGSGKTTTIIQATEWTQDPTIFLAFAKANADDVRGKILKGEAKTLNSLGHRCWMTQCYGARIDFDKKEKLIQRLLPDEARRRIGFTVSRIISAAKNNGFGLDGPGEVQDTDFERFISAGDYDIDAEQVAEVAHFSRLVFIASRQDLSTFDFDDQLYMPVYQQWPMPWFGTILLDEAQDLNTIQHLFVERLGSAGSRLIGVGDRHQAIYMFRGALADSMDQLRDRFRMRELPLSISYRCSQRVIEEAQTLVPHIQARLGAPVGSVISWEDTQMEDQGADPTRDPETWPDGWLILCRNNAPLFSAVMRMVRARKPCRVLSNALEGLAGFLKKFRTDDIHIMRAKLNRWKEKEILAAQAKGMDWKIAAIEDKANTIEVLSEGFETVFEIVSLLKTLSEGRSGPMFATIHKAKGLEADHVYLLRPDLVPGWWIRDPAQLQQEYNLKYVAITRARQTFTYGVRG